MSARGPGSRLSRAPTPHGLGPGVAAQRCATPRSGPVPRLPAEDLPWQSISMSSEPAPSTPRWPTRSTSSRAAIEEYLAGDLSEDVFRVMRLNQGIYGQRQGGTNQMVRVKIPHGRVTPEQLEIARHHRHRVLPGLGPPHHPPERAVPLRPAPRRPRGAPAPRLGRPHQPRGLRRHRAQRRRLPPRRRVPVRGARHHPVGPGRHRPVPAQPDRPAPPPQVQGQLLRLRDRLRPGDVQRRRASSPSPVPAPTARSSPASRSSSPAGSAPLPTRRSRSRTSPPARTCSRPSRPACARSTTTATATTSCGPA